MIEHYEIRICRIWILEKKLFSRGVKRHLERIREKRVEESVIIRLERKFSRFLTIEFKCTYQTKVY